MAETVGQDFILMRFAQLLHCTRCGTASKALSLRNVPVFDDHGCIAGIDAEIRHMECDHVVEGADADPVAIAEMMNEVAS